MRGNLAPSILWLESLHYTLVSPRDPTCAAEKLRPTDIEYTRSDLIPKASVIPGAITKSWELGQKYYILTSSEVPLDWKKATGGKIRNGNFAK